MAQAKPKAFLAKGFFNTPIIDPKTGILTWASTQHFQSAGANMNAPAATVPPPATSASPGTAGQIAFDQNFFYVCIGANSWKRIALTAF